MDKAAFTEADAVKEVAAGACGSMPLGTGLVGGRGWLHQPIPGPVVVWTEKGGWITLHGFPAAQTATIDMLAGKPYFVEVRYVGPNDRLMWKVPGFAAGPVPLGFELPPTTARL